MAAAIPLAIAAGGALLKHQAAKQQAHEQRAQLNQAMARTNATQDKTNDLIEAEAQKLSPVARMAAMATQADQNTAGATADLAASGATDSTGNAIINTAGDNGAVSKEFLTDKADRAIAEGTRLSQIARQLAQVRAPGQLQEQEGQDRANLAEQVGNLWASTGNLNGANQTTAGGIQLPGYSALGDIAQAGASAYGGKMKTSKKGGAPMIWAGGDDTGGALV